MLELAKRFVVAGVAFGVLDYVWLGVVMRTFYRTHIEAFLLTAGTGSGGVRWIFACITYGLLALGMVVFVVPRASRFLFSSFTWGATFGVVVYGVYSCTNMALMRHWPIVLVLLDVGWGIVLCGLVSVLTTAFSSRKRTV